MVVEREFAADDRTIAAQFALPKLVADDGARQATATAVVASREKTAHQGLHAQHTEKIAADKKALGQTRFTAGREIKAIVGPGQRA